MNVDPSEVLNSYSKNQKETIKFFKELGSMNPNPIPSNVLKIDKDSTSLFEIESLMDKKLIEFAKASNKDVNLAVGRFCLALFLIEHTKKLHKTVLTKNRSGLYSLYTSLRNQVCDALTDTYYSSSHDDFLSIYLDLEPLFCACSDLCSLSVPDISIVMKTYKSKVAARIEKL